MMNNKNLKKFMQYKIALIFIIAAFSYGPFLQGEIRYVSKTGTPLPPYTSWATASDNIQTCINISQPGDTIYVAEGSYVEKVTMIPGISLIGSGFESIIDTRTLTFEGFYAMEFAEGCFVSDFFFLVSYTYLNDHYVGNGIRCGSGGGIIRNIKFQKGFIAVFSGENSTVTVEDNFITNFRTGVHLSSSNAFVHNNHITDVHYGVFIEAANNSYMPVVEGNQIIWSRAAGIFVANYPGRPMLRKNYIYLDSGTADGIWGGGQDTLKVYNNLIVSRNAYRGIASAICPALIYNNHLFGIFTFRGIFAPANNKVVNNVITGSPMGLVSPDWAGAVIKYNNCWNNDVNYSSFVPDSTNLSADPIIVNDDSTRGALDFHLQMFSPLINTGDPSILDIDGSRSDMGIFGGPYGESYTYEDLAPRIPSNLTAVLDTTIFLSWNKNTEADFSNYRIYRDTVAQFEIDSLNMISEQQDTSFIQLIPPDIDRLYYKITAVDNQMNESLPSEELVVSLTSNNELPVVISDYILYQNYPNPFNPSTRISYKLKARGYVKLSVYDIKGEIISVPVNSFQEAGFHEVAFVPGSSDASGIYIYHLTVRNENNTPAFSESRKMIYLK